MTTEKAIKKALEEGKAVIGRNRVLRLVKSGKGETVYYAENCPAEWVKELRFYSGISKAQVEEFGGGSDKLGQLCGKPFNVTLLGIKK